MTVDRPSERLSQPVEVYQAQGSLAAQLGVSIDEAVVSLELLAEFRGVPVVSAARWVLGSDRRPSAEEPELDEGTLAILRWHLDGASKPLDHMA